MKNLLFVVLIISIASSGCRDMFGKRIRGNGNKSTETRNLSGFQKIDVSGAIDVFVKTDSTRSVKVEADQNLLQYIVTDEENGTLYIHEADGVSLRYHGKIKVYVAAPSFSGFEASGACKISSENQVKSADKIRIEVSGASNIDLDVNTPYVDAGASGACTIRLKGETKEFKVHGSGSTDIKCFDLLTETTHVDISGAGDAEVSASVKLDVGVSGAGSVKYKGSPSVSQNISGAGSVKKVD